MRCARPSSQAALGVGLALLAAGPLPAAATSSADAPYAALESASVRLELAAARVRPREAFFDAGSAPELRYRIRGEDAVDLKLELVRRETGRALRGWVHRQVAPGRMLEQRWSGLNRRGHPAPDGAYKFRLREKGAAQALGVAKFRFHDHVFPVAGPHTYREGVGDFGAGRSGGRVHEGKDVWADCGTPLVGARGGRVQRRGYDSRLYGHYLVIDGRKTGTDYFYVHLREPADAADGERVRTGQRIGEVGASGNASGVGCMLHLELWPNGFRRGSPIDPEPYLREWDSWS